MHGTLLIFEPGIDQPRAVDYARPIPLAEMKAAIGGGWLEIVPRFDTIAYGNVVMDCVAMCDEEGKIKKLPPNHLATRFWEQALRRKGQSLMCEGTEEVADYLVGPIAVLFGDREFMKTL